MTKKFSARDRVVILSHELWERQFASDASLIGRTIRLNRENYTVIGVASDSKARFIGDKPDNTIYLQLGGTPSASATSRRPRRPARSPRVPS